MIRALAALGLCLALGASATTACAGDFWELRSGDITVMAESREVAAAETATRIVRLRSAVRWLAQWPDDFQPQPVLAFAIEDATFDRYFGRPEPRWGVLNGVGDDRGIALNTHAVNVLTFTISPRDGREFEQLDYLYGHTLLAAGPSANWPPCVRDSLRRIIQAAELREAGRMYVQSDAVTYEVNWYRRPLSPREFIDADDGDSVGDSVRGHRAFSCHALTLMSLHDAPLPRASFAEYFRLIGGGMDVGDAAATAFQIDETQLQRLLDRFASGMRSNARTVRAEISGKRPQWPDPEPVAAERAASILQQLASRTPN